jgi:hypothetical protein
MKERKKRAWWDKKTKSLLKNENWKNTDHESNPQVVYVVVIFNSQVLNWIDSRARELSNASSLGFLAFDAW